MNEKNMLRKALQALARPGAVILIPTETVYGLVCDWEDAAGRERIYQLKGRDHGKPLAMFAADAAMAERFGVRLNAAARRLLERFAPGPITVIAPGSGALATVGLRIPDHPFVLELLRSYGRPLASTSANASGRPNVLCVADALTELTGPVDLAIDGGRRPEDAAASTVIDATVEPVRILRPGPVSEAEIRACLSGL